MTDKLPGNLLALFQPRPPLRYLPPGDYAPEQRRTPHVSGVAAYLDALKNPEEDDFMATESLMQQRERQREERKKRAEEKLKEAVDKCMLYMYYLVHFYVSNYEFTLRRSSIRGPANQGRSIQDIVRFSAQL